MKIGLIGCGGRGTGCHRADQKQPLAGGIEQPGLRSLILPKTPAIDKWLRLRQGVFGSDFGVFSPDEPVGGMAAFDFASGPSVVGGGGAESSSDLPRSR